MSKLNKKMIVNDSAINNQTQEMSTTKSGKKAKPILIIEDEPNQVVAAAPQVLEFNKIYHEDCITGMK